MPSGFQQDSNQLTPSYYRVVIDCANESAYWYTVGDETNDDNTGRISPFSWDNFEGNDLPSTLALSQALARGNLRFQAMIEAVSKLADCQILDVETGANYDGVDQAENGYIAFTIKFDRDEGVFPAYCSIRKAEGANSNGTTDYDNVTYPQYYLYCDNEGTANNTEDALRDVIWKALADDHTRSVRVFLPEEGTDPVVGSGTQQVITASKPFDNDGNGYNDISVSEINGTSTTLTAD